MGESVKEQVIQAMSGAAETEPATPLEEAPSPEVKEEQKTEETVPEKVEEKSVEPDKTPIDAGAKKPDDFVDDEKSNKHIENLNTALSIERESNKALKEKLDRISPVFDKLGAAFNPEKEVEPEKPKEYWTQTEVESWYETKEKAKQEEDAVHQRQELITKQIDSLTTEWNGEGGKPKYDDKEILAWQKENEKMWMTPEEAFSIMKKDDLIDWKAKELIAKSKNSVETEKPSGTSSEHSPSKTQPKTEQELKNAVLEALSSIDEQ